jgi:hypothetical protein
MNVSTLMELRSKFWLDFGAALRKTWLASLLEGEKSGYRQN